MLSKKELTEQGIKFKRLNWRWLPPSYKLETAEFSDDGELWPVDYGTYLSLWANRLNVTRRYDAFHKTASRTDERFAVIRHKFLGFWFITLVEILKETE